VVLRCTLILIATTITEKGKVECPVCDKETIVSSGELLPPNYILRRLIGELAKAFPVKHLCCGCEKEGFYYCEDCPEDEDFFVKITTPLSTA